MPHEIESVMLCLGCGRKPYTLYRVRSEEAPDVWTHRLWPSPEANVPPPSHPTQLRCPYCEGALKRQEAPHA